MKAYLKAWALALIALAVWCAMSAEQDYQKAKFERCSVTRCA
ncbi:hypothetical protein [Caballeronia sp. dw_19]|nr:hypothetical protein [Caballeronia sp. dw_19]